MTIKFLFSIIAVLGINSNACTYPLSETNLEKNKMARTESKMLSLGTKAPDFTLIDAITNKPVSLKDVRGEKGTVVMFICNHCPFVKHVASQLAELGKDYQAKNVGVVAISSKLANELPPDTAQADAVAIKRTRSRKRVGV